MIKTLIDAHKGGFRILDFALQTIEDKKTKTDIGQGTVCKAIIELSFQNLPKSQKIQGSQLSRTGLFLILIDMTVEYIMCYLSFLC